MCMTLHMCDKRIRAAMAVKIMCLVRIELNHPRACLVLITRCTV